ncbi:FAD-dependent monooxygenase [Stenotrophomonas maltophilia]|uniref:Monooxygenase n=1 Tax=Stenotrophomonas maltophilia TaxID=40324 RepID=A0AB34TEW9_STEMA|nr:MULTISPECIES: NAD(P)/FAD-dependent oxidoreductase [Stenotrophomonas]KOO76706.1 monooxygenase [Stenotrophomonas maltophilia]MBH1543941.1 FAD-dependent monooxygenase [Stenotrophomonas maltophilia]MBN4981811.1 FAD-dependent monooxygenase [Stenotrophomonas maltophilia]MDZ7474853.1 NAD(P)/FAD-dependent oxidoreductase [Stenotrophomonas pavanii]
MQPPSRIAIIGAGPAGLTAALILHRGGHRVRVYEGEASGQQRTQGGTLDLHDDSGQVALQRAGLLEAFRAVARHEGQEARTGDPWSGVITPGGFGPEGSKDKPEIDRGDLRQLLMDALPADAVQWGHRLTELVPAQAGGHRLRFANGVEHEADIVIGADGAWSKVRAALSACQPLPTGITFFEGWIERPAADIAAMVGQGSLFCFGGEEALFVQRNSRDRLCVYAALKRSSEWLDARIAQHGMRTLVTGSYAGWAPNLQRVLAACTDFVRRPIYSLPADFRWTPRDGVTLVGDAAHLMPPVGVGVNLAMLDASDVAIALCAQPDAISALREAEALVCERARALMPDAIEGFQRWFITDEAADAGC